MARELVVTSVPRGIKLGRTGFQVVMRTAGMSDVMMSGLEQLAAYRHVYPQGSGRNPVIYSYRSVRGHAGQINVLGRTVDAGNDFSNRSNKLAHLLAVDPDELTALRTSSPPAVLAAIEGRLATVWQGGPEERGAPFALPSPPAQPAVCSRWEAATGDAGWGGVLAQRAVRGQPSLVIASECSPAWCRTLLELFQEVYALLPPDSRWRTTFETTVVGGSSSLLRGTYAGSPESATGYAGLLILDLSSRAAVPANMATDEYVTLARKGPKRPEVRGPARTPSLPPPMGEPATPAGEAAPMAIAQPRAGSHRPPKAPVDWEDDEPRSRLHWYILGGVLLAAAAMAAALLAASYWLDVVAVEKRKKEPALVPEPKAVAVVGDTRSGGHPQGEKGKTTNNEGGSAERDAGAAVAGGKPMPDQPSPAERFKKLQSQLAAYKPRPLTTFENTTVPLASGIEDLPTIELAMPSCGQWKPRVEPAGGQGEDQRVWKLVGLPNGQQKHWGTVAYDKENKQVTFRSEVAANDPQDHLYVPLRFTCTENKELEIDLKSLAAPQQVKVQPGKKETSQDQVQEEPSSEATPRGTLYDVLTGGPVVLVPSEHLAVAASLLGPPALTMKLNRPGAKESPDITLETRESDTSITDLWLPLGGDPAQPRKALLESLSCDCEEDGGKLCFRLARYPANTKAWDKRLTRFGEPDPSKPLGKVSMERDFDKFVRLVDQILEEEDVDAAENTVNSLKQRFEPYLSLKGNEKKPSTAGWRERTFQIVTAPDRPFFNFVRTRFEEEPFNGGKRGPCPQLPVPPKELSPDADAAAKLKYANEKKDYDDKFAKIDPKHNAWNEGLKTRLQSPLWLKKFLAEVPADEKAGDKKAGDKKAGIQDARQNARDLARVLLGIDALLALEDRKDQMRKQCEDIALDSIFTAKLELEWKWNEDDRAISVTRFEITPREQAAKDPQPSTTAP